MTKEDKELLLKDLCARIPYGVKIEIPSVFAGKEQLQGVYRNYVTNESGDKVDVEKAIVYLRPMSSMTEEECLELSRLKPIYNKVEAWKYIKTPVPLTIANIEQFDFFNSHHLDWRGLITKGLVREAPEGMYK